MVPAYYVWLTEEEEYYDAQEVFQTFVKHSDLSEPVTKAIAATGIDTGSLWELSVKANRGDRNAEECLKSTVMFETPLASPAEARYTPVTKHTPLSIEFSEFTPGDFEQLFAIVKANDPLHERIQVCRWTPYWFRRGETHSALEAIDTSGVRKFLNEDPTLEFEIILERQGRDAAFERLVGDFVENAGWSYYSGEKRVKEQWRCVKQHYPDRWFEFIIRTLDRSRASSKQVSSDGMCSSLVQYCLFMDQTEPAGALGEAIVGSIHEAAGTRARRPGIDFWIREKEHRLVSIDTREGEIYRSAFLRALAWALGTRRMDPEDAWYWASTLCPVNLDLWRVRAAGMPPCWPKALQSQSPIDTVPAQILDSLNTLWSEQSTSDGIIAQATGIVAGTTNYEVGIFGVIQACTGPNQPEIRDVYRKRRVTAVISSAAHLRLEGDVAYTPPRNHLFSVADWDIWPLSARLIFAEISRWQWWRGAREVWAPAPWLLKDGYRVVAGGDLEYSVQSQKIGRWLDWPCSFQELADIDMPTATGQLLRISRKTLESATRDLEGNLAWICKWSVVNRKSSYSETVEKSSGFVCFGSSNIVR